MGLTSAMLTGMTGLQSNQFMLETIGDNIANVNTTAFKANRANFETQFYRILQGGSGPSETSGGTNPLEVGNGSRVSSVQRNHSQGSLLSTGLKRDLAIEGPGMFILRTPSDAQFFTRDGSFNLDAANTLVTADGFVVQGFAADATGAITPGDLSDLQIPLGLRSEAAATTEARLDGNLNAAGDLAVAGSVLTSQPLVDANGAAGGGTALIDLVDADGNALFAADDVVALRGVQKGGADLPEARFIVGTDGSTVNDFAGWLESALSINTDPSLGDAPGVIVGDGATGPEGALIVTANAGAANALVIDTTDIRNVTANNSPFSFTSAPADGESVVTSFHVLDSLGSDVEVRIRMALESRSTSGTTWRFYAESPGDTDSSKVVGTGTVSFDQNGTLVSTTGNEITINRGDAGAVDPLAVTLDFSGVSGLATGDIPSSLVLTSQNGFGAGILTDYGVERDGVIQGVFSNGQTRALGQIALATFTNPEGLIVQADNTYTVGPNSGTPVIQTPQAGGAGTIAAGSLEAGNVDLGREFVGMITASTGFSAAGRVVSTADEMLQELLLIVR